jgi:hypothetical protein
LYIWKGKIHNIDNINYDGELIIETINQNQKVFLCFLLRHSYSVTKPNIIDKLWNNKHNQTFTFNLEEVFEKNDNTNSAIYYKNGINTIIVFIKPIDIYSKLESELQYPKCFIISNFSNDYSIVKYNKQNLKKYNIETIQDNINSYIENFTVNTDPSVANVELTEKGLYLDCSPTSQSTNTLPSITLPLDAKGGVNLSNSLIFSSVINSLILFMIIAFLYLSVPALYKYTFVDVIEIINVPDKSTRLKTVSYFAFGSILILSLSLIIDGFRLNSNNRTINLYESYVGFFFGLILSVSTIRLYFLRNNPQYNFQEIYNYSISDIFIWLNEIYYFWTTHSITIGSIYFGCIFILFLFALLTLIAPEKFLLGNDNITHAVTVILGFGCTYSIIFALFIFLIYNTHKVKNNA